MEQEVPYQTAVMVEQLEDTDSGVLRVEATTMSSATRRRGSSSQACNRLKQVGQAARQAIERRLNTRVYLALWVKVRKDWSENEQLIRDMGYV